MDVQRKNTCFLLYPTNSEAQSIVNNPLNQDRRCGHTSMWYLRIGLEKPSKNPGQLVSFGRVHAFNDVILEGRRFSKIQCYFAFHDTTGELLLHDMSRRRNTHLLDGTNGSHWKRSTKQGVVRLDHCEWMTLLLDQAHFLLAPAKGDVGSLHQERLLFAKENPRPDEFANTISLLDAFSCYNTQYDTRVHTPYSPIDNDDISFAEVRRLGTGSFGCVKEVVDLHNGDHYAVKILSSVESLKMGHTEKSWKELVKQEVELHQRLAHDHIVKLITSQGWQLGRDVEIFMPVYEGNAFTLFYQLMDASRRQSLIMRMTRQMLLALDYIHDQGIVHRDVKPFNVLFQDDNFYLCDFGVAKSVNESRTKVGTAWYMAPEVYEMKNQTTKIDIYGLGASILECLGQLPMPGQRSHGIQWHYFLLNLSGNLRSWLATNPDERPTARQLLDREFFPPETSSSLSLGSASMSSKTPMTSSLMEFSMRAKPPLTENPTANFSQMELTLLPQAGPEAIEPSSTGKKSMKTNHKTTTSHSTKQVPNTDYGFQRHEEATRVAKPSKKLSSKPGRLEQTRRGRKRLGKPSQQAIEKQHTHLKKQHVSVANGSGRYNGDTRNPQVGGIAQSRLRTPSKRSSSTRRFPATTIVK